MEINEENIKDTGLYPIWDVESKVNDEECIYCGRCYSACPRDAILFERILPNPQELVRGEITIDDEKCIYCAFCEELCPAQAISIKEIPGFTNDKLNKTIDVDLSRCVFVGYVREYVLKMQLWKFVLHA